MIFNKIILLCLCSTLFLFCLLKIKRVGSSCVIYAWHVLRVVGTRKRACRISPPHYWYTCNLSQSQIIFKLKDNQNVEFTLYFWRFSLLNFYYMYIKFLIILSWKILIFIWILTLTCHLGVQRTPGLFREYKYLLG